MFCWWQDCPPTMEGPCRDRGPFTPCLSLPAATPSKSTTVEQEASTDAGDNSTDSSTYSEEDATEETATATQPNPKFCVIMGRKYEVGDKLPHDTGNCVECVCGPGAKVTCSPHQCAPAGEDINDYRPPGPRQQVPDVF
ncbi:kielin/chordin-like protein [Asbolus verrucosus]|uniref:Kielin/chordin-like protein n=1 Tax=Asbolus verrucosus TaxID=1661398 RepID=A0A482W6J2_ASBVE|nr:kielin/chordin-like protein [Asbolus verrucosus]